VYHEVVLNGLPGIKVFIGKRISLFLTPERINKDTKHSADILNHLGWFLDPFKIYKSADVKAHKAVQHSLLFVIVCLPSLEHIGNKVCLLLDLFFLRNLNETLGDGGIPYSRIG
jgi:hypothetical protein